MTLAGDGRSILRGRPYLVAYLVALAAAWVVSVATWTIVDGTPALHPAAQAPQLLVVAFAATLAGPRLRLGTNPNIPWLTFVGMVGDLRQHGLDSEPTEEIYAPFAQQPQRAATVA